MMRSLYLLKCLTLESNLFYKSPPFNYYNNSFHLIKYLLYLHFAEVIPIEMDRWILPLCKTYHKGKTHIAIALVIKSCLEGCKVLFKTMLLFIKQLKSNMSFRAYQSKLSKYDLLILDELDYISVYKEDADLLFIN